MTENDTNRDWNEVLEQVQARHNSRVRHIYAEGIELAGGETRSVRADTDQEIRTDGGQRPEDNTALFERDLAVRQLQVQQANLKVIQMALNESRPLEALRTVNNALDELEDELDRFDEIDAAREANSAEDLNQQHGRDGHESLVNTGDGPETDGGQPVGDIEIPNSHPLAGKEHLLDTHEGHLEAYAEVLDEADPEEIYGAMVILYGPDGADTLPTVSIDVDPRWASLWMLGSHIHHVATSAQDAGGNLTMEQAALDAIEYVRQHGFELDGDLDE